MTLGSTQPLTEMSTGVFPGGKGSWCVRLTTIPPSCAIVMKSGNINFLEPSGPLQACNRTALPFTFTTVKHHWNCVSIVAPFLGFEDEHIHHNMYTVFVFCNLYTCQISFTFIILHIEPNHETKTIVDILLFYHTRPDEVSELMVQN